MQDLAQLCRGCTLPGPPNRRRQKILLAHQSCCPLVHHTKLKKIILCMVWHTRQQSQFLNCSAKCRMQSFPKKNTMYFVCERQTGVNPQKTDFWNWALITRTDVLKKPKERGKEMREQRRQLPDRTAHWIEWNWRRGSWYVVEQERTRKENDGKEKQMITKADTTCSRNMSAWACCSRRRNSRSTAMNIKTCRGNVVTFVSAVIWTRFSS